ncbi:hypothetical protein GGR51DRAFT_514531 [Nemania sp. FL0031]|nr:hypothetical protein GGR51DRAFT_514531 [Nemania sp. FL0031]
MTRKPWIYTKSTSLNPDGAFSLGQIIVEPKDPFYILQPRGPFPIPDELAPEHTGRDNATVSDNSELSVNWRGWIRAVGIPLGVETNGQAAKKDEEEWHVKSLEDSIFWPDVAYVRSAMGHSDVPETLKGFGFKRRVYMVTGIRIARGAVLQTMTNQSSLELGGIVEGSIADAAVPLSGGGVVGIRAQINTAQTAQNVQDFVFAYKLNEVSYRGIVTHKPYNKGEVSGGPLPPKLEDSQRATLDDFKVIGLDEDEFDGDESEGFDYLKDEFGVVVNLVPK